MDAIFRAVVNEIEEAVEIDLDGDGRIGNRAPTAPMPKPTEAYVETVQAANGRAPNHRSLFIGINYIGSSAELRGCINDVRTLQALVERLGFPLDDMRTLTEEEDLAGWAAQPTKAEIVAHLDWLVEGALPGDTLFLHYSGHGTSVTDHSGDEEDGKDEALVPLDYQSAGMITDDEIYARVVGRLPDGVRLTAVLDCCHSGTLLDLPFMFEATKDNLAAGRALASRKKRAKYANRGAMFAAAFADRDVDATETPGPDVIMFSGCKDSQTSADVSNTNSFDVPADPNDPGSAGGACTNSLAEILCKYPTLRYTQLLKLMRENLERRGFTQIPQMSSSKKVDLNAVFSLWGHFD